MKIPREQIEIYSVSKFKMRFDLRLLKLDFVSMVLVKEYDRLFLNPNGGIYF